MIRLLNQKDCETWIELAGEVEHLFGPMRQSEEFREGIQACIDSGNAYGIEHEDGSVAGILAMDGEKNEIVWLAVGQKFRGNKYGDRLVKKAIERLARNGDIYVQTFSDEVGEGKGARIVYERNGFVDVKGAGKNPAGIETVIMVRRKNLDLRQDVEVPPQSSGTD